MQKIRDNEFTYYANHELMNMWKNLKWLLFCQLFEHSGSHEHTIF